jgi:PAS domain S-box-containing protein
MNSALAASPLMSANDKVNILMVDDNPAKLLTYEAILAGLGENLIAATSGREALENLLRHDVAVILMDVSMPDMDGFEIADIIRQHPRFQRVAIIFVSAIHLTDLDCQKGYERGAVDYITVPVVPEVLRAKVAVFADLHRKTRQLEALNRDLKLRVRERTEKLWESEGQFRTLANSIPQLAWMSAPDGSRLWYSQRWYSYTGTSFQQLEGDGWMNYYHPSHVERVCAGLRNSIDTGEEWEDTHPILGQDGRYRWFLSRAVPIHDSQNRVVRWFATATDVTCQIEAEERIKVLNRNLAQQINQLQTIMEVLPVGVAVAEDPECTKVSGNTALREMLGMNANENLSLVGFPEGAAPFAFYQDLQRVPIDRRPLRQAVRTKSAIGGSELEIRRQDGRLIHAVVSASPLLDDFGEVQGAVAAVFDATSRRAMEETLRERAELIDLTSEAIIVRDRLGLVRYWNLGAERLYGWKRNEIIGKHLHNTLETRFPIPFQDIQDMIAWTGRWEGNLIQRTKNGTEITIACRKALKTEDGSGTILEINRDITGELQIQEVLRKTEKLAAMGRVAGMIAHEINNPLEAIINAVFLLLKHPSLDAEARDYAQMANEELRRVAYITRQTLSFYRESQQPVPVAITEILENILSLHQQSLVKSGVTPQVKMRSRQTILGLPGELRQVFLNLVVNAIQSMPNGGRLRVHVHESMERQGLRKGVRISICDTGTGIQPEDGERIFEPFFTTKSMKGTGLGLWISRGIVHKYEGTIRYRSLRRSCRNITCFSVFLPGAHEPSDALPFDKSESPDQLPLWEPKAS